MKLVPTMVLSITGCLLAAGAIAHELGQEFDTSGLRPASQASLLAVDVTREQPYPMLAADNREPLGLPGLRPRLTMSLPAGRDEPVASPQNSAFSWSLEAWQLNTASLAHIQCNHHTLTIDSFLAEDCRFVDQPLPDDSVNLVQLRGEWTATPGLRVGLGAFHARQQDQYINTALHPAPLLSSPVIGMPGAGLGGNQTQGIDGMDLNVSFGISTEKVGEFLVGLQVARYRQRMSLVELGLAQKSFSDVSVINQYANSAQLALGWRRGSLSGDLLGHHKEAPLWPGGSTSQSAFSSFDLEFSWRPRNASLSIGISNLLDASPRADDTDIGLDDPLDSVFGRIPYVRYKHDL